MHKIVLMTLTCTLAVAFANPAMAAKKKGARKSPRVPTEAQFQQSLNRLDPQTRLEQICDREAMKRLKDDRKLLVDRAQGAASADAKTEGHKLTSLGGAYRIKSGWFGLTYVCEASPDHAKVLSFKYDTGGAIPKSKWEDYGLWD